MAFVLADRVEETSATAGTGPLALAGASPGGFRTFGSVMATGDTTRYTYYDAATGVWETGLGTYTAGTPPTLSRGPAATSAGGTAPVALPGNAAARVFIAPDAGYFATLAPRNNPAITGGTIDGAAIGNTTAAAGRFTNLVADDLVAGFLRVGNNASTNTNILFNGAAGSFRPLQFQSAGVNRWTLSANNFAETGANAG